MAVQNVDRVRVIVSDGYVSDSEARELSGTTDGEALAVLFAALERDTVTASTQALTLVDRTLATRGYVLPAPETTAAPRLRPLPQVGRADADFARLERITGNTSGKVIVAMADAPIDFRHPLLAPNAWTNPDANAPDQHGWDFERNRPLQNDGGDDHGNATTSLTVRGTGRILAIGGASTDNIDYGPLWRAIDYAVDRGARVINMSLAIQTPEAQARLSRILEANPGVLFVLAAGNDNKVVARGSQAAAMARHTNLVVVGGSNIRGGIWQQPGAGSAVGPQYVTLSARADNVVAAGTYDQARIGNLAYTDHNGTSFAAPQVSNTASKCMLLCPELTATDLWRILIATADKSADWAGASRSEGLLNETRAMSVAAVFALVQRGQSTEDAITRVASSTHEARLIRAAINRLPTIA